MKRSSQRQWMAAARLAALALIVAVLPACSFFGKEDVIPDDPADKLYNQGLFLMNSKHDYKQAAKRFEEVDRQHPYSEWARKALLMSAYAYYEGTNYDDSIIAAKRYVTLHPGSPDAAYAQYLIATASTQPRASRMAARSCSGTTGRSGPLSRRTD